MEASRALWVMASLLAVAGVGLAQSPDGPPLYEPIEQTECWTCHGPGVWDPDIDPLVDIVPALRNVTTGDEFSLDVEVFNAWLVPDRDIELMDFRVTLDISEAPSLVFVSDTPPVLDEQTPGTIEFDPNDLSDPNTLTTPQTGFVTLQIPQGATDVRVRLVPDDPSATTGPDLTLNIHPGVNEPNGQPARSVDEGGPGATETFHADTPADFGELGFGNWTVEAQITYVDAGKGQVFPPGSVGFTVVMDAWFNASTEVRQVRTASDNILPEQRVLMDWPLRVQADPQAGERLRYTVNVTSFYEHEGAEPDWQDHTIQIDEELEVDGGVTPRLVIGRQDAAGPTVVEAPGVSIAAISEAIGYIGAFLLIASVWTGGMFGKASRRQLNTVFGSARRRVAFHNFLSYGIIAFSLVHMFIFLWDINGPIAVDGYHFLVGVLWGGPAILAMLLLGVTGALQVPMIRKWNYAFWRWSHFGLAIAAIVFTVVHMLLDGQNFSFIQDALDYTDPLVPDDRA